MEKPKYVPNPLAKKAKERMREKIKRDKGPPTLIANVYELRKAAEEAKAKQRIRNALRRGKERVKRIFSPTKRI